jgi:DNA-binding transcriptional MerR regulator
MERIMSLSQKSRAAIYEALADLGTDPDAVEEFLSHFPSRDLDEPATKEFLRAETATLRAEIADNAAQLRAEIADNAAQLRAEMAELRSELRAEMAELRTEMHVGFAELRAEMHQGFQRMTLSLAALMVSMTGVMVAAVTIAR